MTRYSIPFSPQFTATRVSVRRASGFVLVGNSEVTATAVAL
jgi:hypothetical protein